MPPVPPPSPTWHGFTDRLLAQYAAFVLKYKVEMAETRPRELRAQLDQLNSNIDSYTSHLTQLRRERSQIADQIAELEQQLRGPDDETVAREVARLLALPGIVGTRVDRNGMLVIQLRVTVDTPEGRRDIGDYELPFTVVSRRHYGESPWYLVVINLRRPQGISRGHLRQLAHYDSEHEADFLYYRLDNDPSGMLIEGRLADLAQQCIGAIRDIRSPEQYPLLEAGNEPESVWDGFTVNPGKALRRLIRLQGQSGTVERLTALRSDVEYIDSRISTHTRRMREAQAKLRQVRAELAQLEANASPSVEIDLPAVARELRFITMGIPGVMGMKFDTDGTPILHIRTSYEQDGRRYDFGDFEVHLRKSDHSTAGVLRIYRTRETYSYYWSTYDRLRDGRETGYFCFGGRAGELYSHFERGEFGILVHLLVNSMNSVNKDSRDHVGYGDFPEIPLTSVWRSRPRQRPRRRPRAQEGAATEVLAV